MPLKQDFHALEVQCVRYGQNLSFNLKHSKSELTSLTECEEVTVMMLCHFRASYCNDV